MQQYFARIFESSTIFGYGCIIKVNFYMGYLGLICKYMKALTTYNSYNMY